MKKVGLSRRDFIRSSSLAAVGTLAGGFGSPIKAGADSVRAVVQRAGNADTDQLRLSYLKELGAQSGLDASVKEDLVRLITQIERWLGDKRLDYFGREAGRKLDFDFGIAEESVLYPLTWLYRGRMVIWYALESGGVWNIPDRKRQFFAAARAFFEKYAEVFPENRTVRMYLGHPAPPRNRYETVPGAPQWAIHQREGLERLTDIIEWWIDNRMQDDGQYGGGWGDDCEMWRWWVPVLIGFDSPKISRAQARFSKALMDQSHMKAGYTTRMSDVEHTAEDSADAITPMMHIDPANDRWRRYALKLAEFMENDWTARNQRGFLQFKSTYFTADKVDTNPQRACDTVYHPRVVQPTLLYWQRTSDKRLTRLFAEWMDTWVDAAARCERGKPAGIIPTAIHFPEGNVGGLGPDWWDPRNHGEYTLYLYPSAMDLMTHTLLLTHHMTGDDKYLAPIRSMADIRLKYLSSPPQKEPAAGTEAWCASRLGALAGVIAKYRFLTGNTEFDDLLARDMSPYMRFRLRGDWAPLVSALRQNAEALRINFEGYTSEVRYTDRVLRFPTLFAGSEKLAEPTEAIHTPNPSLLYSMVTGDPGDAGYFPLNAVRWLTPPRDIAALVTESASTNFAAQLFCFDAEPRSMSAEFYLLDPGKYRLTVTPEGDEGRQSSRTYDFTVQGPRTRVSFTLPARKVCVLSIRADRVG